MVAKRLDRDRTAVVLVDVQGKLARMMHDSDEFIASCAKLLRGAQALGLPIVWLEQNPEKLGPTVPELSDILDGEPISKFHFDGCTEPSVINYVEQMNVDTFVICGMETQICVYLTATGLTQQGYQVQVAADCVASRSVNNKKLALEKMVRNGVELTSVEMCLFELVQDCRDESFRQILDIIR